jgi:hypothetical protein
MMERCVSSRCLLTLPRWYSPCVRLLMLLCRLKYVEAQQSEDVGGIALLAVSRLTQFSGGYRNRMRASCKAQQTRGQRTTFPTISVRLRSCAGSLTCAYFAHLSCSCSQAFRNRTAGQGLSGPRSLAALRGIFEGLSSKRWKYDSAKRKISRLWSRVPSVQMSRW